MKKEIKKSSKKSTQQEEGWIDVHNDDLMIKMIGRSPVQSSRDESVWSRTSNERKMLRKLKGANFSSGTFGTIPRKIVRFRSKLVIYLKNNKKFDKTTYSTECWQHEIPNILAKFYVKDKNIVKKYSWNGQTYAPNNLPFSW